MTIHLAPEQERRIRAVLSWGAYQSVEEVLQAALECRKQANGWAPWLRIRPTRVREGPWILS
jgi:Arc/MetJ-type ribon-helix-helix transcriptional regulator